MKPKVFIIILNWNQPDLTISCLKSVAHVKTNTYKLETVVVDNGSTDTSVREIKKAFPSITLLETGANLGFAGGNNKGITYALENGADYVMLLNNDTEVAENLVEGLLKTFSENPKAGAISPKIYFAKGYEFHKHDLSDPSKEKYTKDELGKVIWYAGGSMDWNNVYGSNYGVDEVDHGQFEKVQQTDFATGCCVLYKGEVLREVGLLDENYYLYLEDADLSLRIKRNGYNVLYTPYAHLWHKVSQSSAIGSQLNDYFITRNRLLFGMKYAPMRAKIALLRESIRFILHGREWQAKGARDFYLLKFGRGSWK